MTIEDINNQSYGFTDRLSSLFPSQIIVDLTEVCNLGCIHCPHPEFKKSSIYTGAFLERELSKKLVREVKKHGEGNTQYIRYTGNGEPLIHPHSYEMLEDAVLNSGVLVTLTTNGTILDEKRAKKLIDSGVHMLDISIDAVNEDTYSKIRIGGKLQETVRNVRRFIHLIENSCSNTKLVVSFVEQEQNRSESRAFEQFWKNEGASAVVIRRLHTSSGALQLKPTTNGFSTSVERYPCLYPWERLTLTPRGQLSFCPTDWVHGAVIPETCYEKVTIKEIWAGNFMQELRRSHLKNDFKKDSFCGQCPDWQQTRWPWQGRSYANLIEDISNVL